MTVTVDSTTEPVNLVWYAGDDWAQTFRLMLNTDTPMDLSPLTIRAGARPTLGPTVALTVNIPDPTDGILTIHPPPEGLQPDVYDYDIQFDDDTNVATWIRGRIQVRRDVTT